jgi:hypothetical protein
MSYSFKAVAMKADKGKLDDCYQKKKKKMKKKQQQKKEKKALGFSKGNKKYSSGKSLKVSCSLRQWPKGRLPFSAFTLFSLSSITERLLHCVG